MPQTGHFTITTELGVLDVAPGQVALLPRGLGALWRRARALPRFPVDQAEVGPSRSPVSASSIDSRSAASS